MILKRCQESFFRKSIVFPDIESAFRSIRAATDLAMDFKRCPLKAFGFLLQEGLQRLPTGQLQKSEKPTVSCALYPEDRGFHTSSATQAVLARKGAALQTQSLSCALMKRKRFTIAERPPLKKGGSPFLLWTQHYVTLINRSFASAITLRFTFLNCWEKSLGPCAQRPT